MKYTRVIPRDLFNEAKLLKCMGRLCLLIHDNTTPVKMSFEHSGDPFNIVLHDDGQMEIRNLKIFIGNDPFMFTTTYNSKSPYPLVLEHDYCQYPVFNDDGSFDKEFIEFVKAL